MSEPTISTQLMEAEEDMLPPTLQNILDQRSLKVSSPSPFLLNESSSRPFRGCFDDWRLTGLSSRLIWLRS